MVMCITIDRSAGRAWGFKVGKDGVKLHVIAISDNGIIPDWNRENSDLAIEPGDIIVKVNGIEMDSGAMSQECKKDEKINLRVLKGNKSMPAE